MGICLITLSELTKSVFSSLEITIALIGSGDVASMISSRFDSYLPLGFLHLEILNILPSSVPVIVIFFYKFV
jgi:hypothetical protein